MLAFVWAQDQNGLIGRQGHLPWHLPSDMHHFQQLTVHHEILAGRKTYQSFGRPLPHRQNLVLTSHPSSEFPASVKVFNTSQDFLKYARKTSYKVIRIVGGAQIFQLFRSKVDILYRTVIQGNFRGDTYMPKINYAKFKLVHSVSGTPDQNNHYPYRFETFRRL